MKRRRELGGREWKVYVVVELEGMLEVEREKAGEMKLERNIEGSNQQERQIS